MNILLAVAILLLLTMLGLVIGTTWFLWQERTTASSTLRDAHVAIIEVGLTAKNLREASMVWKKASQDQSSAITSAAQNVSAVAKQLSQSASAIEKSSTALLSELTQDASAQSTALLQNQKQFQTNLQGIQAATGELRQTLRDADKQISNPAIPETIQHIDNASANAEAGLEQGKEILTDGRQIADKVREDFLKPAKLWWTVVEKILGIGPPIVTAIK